MRDLRIDLTATALALALLGCGGCSGDSSQQQVTSSGGGGASSTERGPAGAGGSGGSGAATGGTTGDGGTTGGGGEAGSGGGGAPCEYPDSPDPNSTSHWTPLAQCPVIHGYFPSAVKLSDDRVLLLGGALTDSEADQFQIANADIYDSTSDTWTAAAPMPGARGVNAVLLGDGRVLAAGKPGSTVCPSDVWIYDPIGDSWTVSAQAPIAPGTPPNVLPSGRVLLLGPNCANSAIISEIYDPATNTWTGASGLLDPAPSVPDTSTRLIDGGVLIAGGSLGIGNEQGKGAQEYSELADAWTRRGSMQEGHWGFLMATLTDGRVLAVGNILTEVFDPPNDAWTLGGTHAACGDSHSSVTAISNGMAFAAGGAFTDGASGVFEPLTNRWRAVDPIPDGERFGHAAVRLDDDSVLILGGLSGLQGGDCAGCFIPALSDWRFHPN